MKGNIKNILKPQMAVIEEKKYETPGIPRKIKLRE